MRGTVARVLPSGAAFICPDDVSFADRAGHLYCHHRTLARAGITEISAGALIDFDRQSSRYPGQKDEAQNVRLLAA